MRFRDHQEKVNVQKGVMDLDDVYKINEKRTISPRDHSSKSRASEQRYASRYVVEQENMPRAVE